ncbi:MAG: DUF1559 domain-containing protein [Phycisphaerales bacterium]|nr:DUF1559 domain-containing protein [Phycisphaerales bacterium]
MDFSAYHNPKGVNVGYVDGSVRFYNFVDDNLPETVYQGYTYRDWKDRISRVK